MLPKTHILIGFVVSLAIFLLFPQIGWFYALIIFLSSFLIDFDHYLWYVFKKKDWSVTRAISWMHKKRDFLLSLSVQQRNQYQVAVMIFHGVEGLALVALLIFVHEIFLFVLIGMLIHLALDLIELYYLKFPLYIKISQIYTHIKNRKKLSL